MPTDRTKFDWNNMSVHLVGRNVPPDSDSRMLAVLQLEKPVSYEWRNQILLSFVGVVFVYLSCHWIADGREMRLCIRVLNIFSTTRVRAYPLIDMLIIQKKNNNKKNFSI